MDLSTEATKEYWKDADQDTLDAILLMRKRLYWLAK